MRTVVAIAFLLVACGDRPRSPFVVGAPPAEIQERFLKECGVPEDGRHPGATNQYYVTSDYPVGVANKTMCRVRLYWTGDTIDAVEVLVDNDRTWLEEFVRTAVLPLLTPEARAVVDREFLANLATTPRRLTRLPALGGQLTLELRWHDSRGTPGFEFGQLIIRR